MTFLQPDDLLFRYHSCLVEMLGEETTRFIGELLAFELRHSTMRSEHRVPYLVAFELALRVFSLLLASLSLALSRSTCCPFLLVNI